MPEKWAETFNCADGRHHKNRGIAENRRQIRV